MKEREGGRGVSTDSEHRNVVAVGCYPPDDKLFLSNVTAGEEDDAVDVPSAQGSTRKMFGFAASDIMGVPYPCPSWIYTECFDTYDMQLLIPWR